jgi:hypothetical protein
MTGKAVPIPAWDSGTPFAMIRFTDPEELGGLGDILAKATLLAKTSGRDLDDITNEVTFPFAIIQGF